MICHPYPVGSYYRDGRLVSRHQIGDAPTTQATGLYLVYPCYYLHEGIALIGKIDRNPEIQAPVIRRDLDLACGTLVSHPDSHVQVSGLAAGRQSIGVVTVVHDPKTRRVRPTVFGDLLVDSPSCRVDNCGI